MKLRNKKTGDIWEFDGISMAISDSTKEKLGARGCSGSCYARSISELNDDWEDYTPTEPLIKDEDKLDAVKSFFALLCITKEIYYQSVNNCFYHTDNDGITYAIDFDNDNGIDNLCTGLPYTSAELCGEGEECEN